MHYTNLKVEGIDISSNRHADFTAKLLTRWISGYTNTFTFTTIWLQTATSVIFSQLKYSAHIQHVLALSKTKKGGLDLALSPGHSSGGVGTRLVWTLWL